MTSPKGKVKLMVMGCDSAEVTSEGVSELRHQEAPGIAGSGREGGGIMPGGRMASLKGFPNGSVGKEPACNAGDTKRYQGRSPGEGSGNTQQYSCHGESHGRRSLADYSLWGCKESVTTERLSTQEQSVFKAHGGG